MSGDNPSILGQIWRIITFYRLRKALGLARVADSMFTGSASGIADAYDLHREKLIRTYKELEGAVAEVETVMEDQRQQLQTLNEREDKLIKMREGALAAFEQAQAANDTANMSKHQAAFNRYDGEIQQIEAQQKMLEAQIKESEANMAGHMQGLTNLQAEIQKLPAEKAQQIAAFVSSRKIMELNDRLRGLQSSVDAGPIEAVRAANAKLTAQARVSSKLAGTDAACQDEQYLAAGSASTSGDRMAAMLAERQAKNQVKTGTAKQEERPQV